MSWMRQLYALILGKSELASSFDTLARRVVDRVEPEIWGLAHDRILTRPDAEARGYVWARAALSVERTTNELAPGLCPSQRARIVAESRGVIADRVIEQLRMYQDRLPGRRAA